MEKLETCCAIKIKRWNYQI